MTASEERTPDYESESSFDVVVVGGGQAGLAIGYFLKQQGPDFLILEAGPIASAWRERWDSLTLFTPRRYSSLPGFPFPGDPDGYPTRDEVVAYLEDTPGEFELPIKLSSAGPESQTAEDGRFVLEVDGRRIMADQVVVATGPFQAPFVPDVAERLAPDVFQIHSDRLPQAERRAGWYGSRRRRGQHRLPDREGALVRRTRSISLSGRVRRRFRRGCSAAICSGG